MQCDSGCEGTKGKMVAATSSCHLSSSCDQWEAGRLTPSVENGWSSTAAMETEGDQSDVGMNEAGVDYGSGR